MQLLRSFVLSILALFPALAVSAQIDDVSDAVGLPIPIGAPVIYGQVAIRNMPKDAKRPVIFVYLRDRGAQVTKYQANDKGYWYFLRQPVNGQTVVFEVDGSEVGQTFIAAGVSNRVRQDVEFDWNALRGASQSQTGTVSVRDRYDRPTETRGKFDDATAASKAGRNEEALRMFTEVAAADPNDFTAWVMIGTLQYNGKRYDEARDAFSKAIKLKPDHFLAHLNCGRLEVSQKRYDKALPLLTRAVEIDGASADANHLLGETLLQLKKGSLAVAFLNRAIELDPAKADLHLRLAALYDGAGYKPLASAEYVRVLAKVKEHPDRKKFEQYVKDNPPKQ